jgi:cyanobactin maturation PatA/PatG family protease
LSDMRQQITRVSGPSMPPLEGLQALWQVTQGDPGICIAVLDGPVDMTHPCFAGADLVQGETLVPGVARPDGAASAHGTHVASTLFGQPESPVQGVAPRCRGLSLPVYTDSPGSDGMRCTQLDLARAISQAVQHGAQIINISGGEIAPSGQAQPLLAEAVQLCAEQRVLIVAAAGNDGCACLHIPAALPSVLVVGAQDEQGVPLTFSNWGPTYQLQGLLAPGAHIPGAVPGGGVAARSGTSFATPLVAGVAALLLHLQQQQGRAADPQYIREVLLASATPCAPHAVVDTRQCLRGSLNVASAHAYLVQASTPAALVPSLALPARPSHIECPGAMLADASPAVSTPIVRTMGQHTVTQRSHCMPDLHPQDVQVDAPACLMPQEDPEAAQVLAAAALDPVVPPPAQSPAPAPLASPANLQHHSATIRPSQVRPAQEAGAMVYALGTLGYDFGTDARRDWFDNALDDKTPEDMRAMLDYFAAVRDTQPDSRAYAAEALIWTLNLDATPIYALQPTGPYAAEAYRRLRDYLRVQINNLHGNDVTRVAVPGGIAGTVTLRSGQVVPVIVPDLRGLTQSTSAGLSTAQVTGQTLTVGEQLVFRLFYELRNLGVSPQDRARNAMSVLNIAAIGAGMTDMALEGVQVEQSPVCRPGSDCWDVVITAFNPTDRLARARRMFRQTVDVSDVIPVFMGSVRQWDVY